MGNPSPGSIAAMTAELRTLSKGALIERLITTLRALEHANQAHDNLLAQLAPLNIFWMDEEYFLQWIRPNLRPEFQHLNVDEYLENNPAMSLFSPTYGHGISGVTILTAIKSLRARLDGDNA